MFFTHYICYMLVNGDSPYLHITGDYETNAKRRKHEGIYSKQLNILEKCVHIRRQIIENNKMFQLQLTFLIY